MSKIRPSSFVTELDEQSECLSNIFEEVAIVQRLMIIIILVLIVPVFLFAQINWTKHTIADNFNGAASVYAIDLDNDEDVDVLGATRVTDEITWWKNDGNENFNEHTIAGNFNGAHSVYAIDLDDDNDVDVLGAALYADDITWWESDLAFIDVGIISIDMPDIVPEDTTLSPRATVKNLGTNTETFDVFCKIESGAYTSTETVTALAPDDSIQVTFFPDFTFDIGYYTVTVYTQLAGDINPLNDTLGKVVQTYDPGIAEGNSGIPETFAFNAPTITKSRTDIRLAVSIATKVDLVVYDALGRLSKILISEMLSAGTHTISPQFDLPAGVYFYNLKTESGRNTIKKILNRGVMCRY